MSKALLVGINYVATPNELKGCINDIVNIKSYLITKAGYLDGNITVMTDETVIKPTRRNILTQLLALILSDAKKLYFHYSGHGSQVIDKNRDEEDGFDECLVPIDFNTILDDELRGLMTCLKEDQQLTIVLDSCHSGSAIDLSYNLYQRSNKFLMVKDNVRPETLGQVVMISGCLDNQTSADIVRNNLAQGALTWALILVLNSGFTNYNDFITKLRINLLVGGYPQTPNLSSGKSINLLDKLIL